MRLLVLALVSPTIVCAQPSVDGFVARSFTSSTGVVMPYRLFTPRAAVSSGALPLVIYLHGGGGAGTDNLKQLSTGNVSGTRLWIGADVQRDHPAYVVAPQLPEDQQWSAPDSKELAPYASIVVELIAALESDFKIDARRVYLTGQSRGGRGVWDFLGKRPDLFAAAVPVCGDGDTTRIGAARDVPVWAFHGALDDVIPVQGSRDLVAALQKAGGNVRYTEVPDAGHNVWLRAYADTSLVPWVFSQRRAR